MQIVYCVDNKLGGITSLNFNLINNKPNAVDQQWVIHIDHAESVFAKSNTGFNADQQISFSYSSKDNLHNVVSRLNAILPEGPGAIILNDGLEMMMLDHFETGLTSYQIVHDDYNYELALQFGHIVDVMIAHSRFFYEKLLESFPAKADRIFYLPHGVSVTGVKRVPTNNSNKIKLLFLGRITTSKGIFDLPEIGNYLKKWGVPHSWTIIGSGPEMEEFKKKWDSEDDIVFYTPKSNEEVIRICSENDLFVLPTKFEGSPVSLLETMSTGLVPVITDLPGGIREIVKEEIGFRVLAGNNKEFALHIQTLAKDPTMLNRMSENCMSKIAAEFDVRNTSARYHELFNRYMEFHSPGKAKKSKIGSVLDLPLLPNSITRLIRNIYKG